jgi:DtxR family transcriptional regulator, Mn-dependent transcriptional regulator
MISNKAEEILESLWIRLEERKIPSVSLENLKIAKDDPSFLELLESGYATSRDGSKIEFTDNGRKYGRDIVRRHRLAERLLADVLDVNGDLANEKACEFEHLLHKGIDDKICTLLGHPRLCPHGHAIPPGKCCENEQTELKIVSPLSELSPGQSGKIAYVHTGDDSKLQKMMAIGVIPGMKIKLLQSFPSFLFELGNSQFAVDASIAREIFVRLINE